MRNSLTMFAAAFTLAAAWLAGCTGAGTIAPMTGMIAELGCAPSMSGSNSIAVSFTCSQQGGFAASATIDASEQGFSGPFSATSSNSGVASVQPTGGGDRFTVSAGQPGSAHVMVSDGRGNDKEIDIDVKDREESPEPGESGSPEPTESP